MPPWAAAGRAGGTPNAALGRLNEAWASGRNDPSTRHGRNQASWRETGKMTIVLT